MSAWNFPQWRHSKGLFRRQDQQQCPAGIDPECKGQEARGGGDERGQNCTTGAAGSYSHQGVERRSGRFGVWQRAVPLLKNKTEEREMRSLGEDGRLAWTWEGLKRRKSGGSRWEVGGGL